MGPGGAVAAVVVGGGVVAYEARTLTPLRAEAPCQVEALWWLDSPERVLLACGPGQGPALTLNLRTGERIRGAAPLPDARTAALRVATLRSRLRRASLHGSDALKR